MFEVMANKSLREYSALTPDNIRTGPTVAVGDAAFELKPVLINMVQAGWSGLSASHSPHATCDFLVIGVLYSISNLYKPFSVSCYTFRKKGLHHPQ
jgi:hypothetical protein